jgi:hypothetical protein
MSHQFPTAAAAREAMHAASLALALAAAAYQQLLHGDPGADVASNPQKPPAGRRQVEACILEAAPAPHERPVTLKQLAKRAGYSYSEWFRKEVDKLTQAGELVRTGKGVRRVG